MSPLTWLQLPIADRPDTNSDEPLDRMTNGRAHAPNLAVAAFVNGDTQQPWLRLRYACRMCDAVIQFHAGP